MVAPAVSVIVASHPAEVEAAVIAVAPVDERPSTTSSGVDAPAPLAHHGSVIIRDADEPLAPTTVTSAIALYAAAVGTAGGVVVLTIQRRARHGGHAPRVHAGAPRPV
ncbi:hypothetical protein [Microbacterium hominis]|uniref:Uncharacterized protein n=1 Tax=Microbacterium hominis TaxID=162426 RepID=A0A7D4QB87_9MICO|nr:hypothetical protein [Microbacterium hominis]QKJ18297.1 hypothetical protein HQM25_02030 [Microbacterium hominis]